MNDEKTNKPATQNEAYSEHAGETPSIWQDPNVPVGNAPPLPRWPIGVFAVAWAGWVIFLIALLVSINPTAPQ